MKPLLYPTGSLTQPTFKLTLQDKNVEVDEIMIYQTKPHSKLNENLLMAKINKIDSVICVVYFSPSGVEFTLPLLKNLQLDLNSFKVKFRKFEKYKIV